MSTENSRVNLVDINQTNNPRCPCKKLVQALAEEGYADWTPLQLVQDLALSADAKDKAEFCRLVEKYETEPQDLLELAASRRVKEIQPIVLRAVKVKGEIKYALVAGERRLLAAAYNHTKHGDKADVGAVVIKATEDEAYDYAVQETLNRKDATEVEKGHIFRAYKKKVNPDSQKKFTLREIAARLCLDYQYVRAREALTYLSEADQRAVEEGRLGLTKAAEKGTRIRQGKSDQDEPVDPKKNNRAKTMTFRQWISWYDEHRDESDDYRRALADVSGMTLKQADRESDKRLKEAKTAV